MISCTIWYKENGKFTGIVANNGDLLNTGLMLLNYYNSENLVKSLISSGSMSKIEPSIDKCIKYENGSNVIFRSLTAAQMKLIAQEHLNGAYAYIFDVDSNQWWFGLKMKLPLLHAIKR